MISHPIAPTKTSKTESALRSGSNHHFDQLADAAVKAIEKAGGKAYLTYPAVITDGMAMGMDGMKYSLPSRDLIANHIELMHDGYRADALLTIGGCDKTQPGALMPIVRGDHIGVPDGPKYYPNSP